MTTPIDRAREVLAAQPPMTVGVYEGYAWLGDSDGEICCGAYPDGRPREDQARAIVLAHAIAGPALDLAEAVDKLREVFHSEKEPDAELAMDDARKALAALLAALDRALEADRG